MYVLVLDYGSTNFKALVLKIEDDTKEGNVKIIGKERKGITDFALFVNELLKKYHINKNEIEKIVVTGTGSSYLEDSFDDIEIIKINEFDAIAYGGLILSKKEKANIVSIGTGTAIVYSDFNIVKRIGGTGLGGGTLVGLGKAILSDVENGNMKVTSFKNLIEMAKLGDKSKVDLTIGDINKDSIENMTKDITAANFAAVNKSANVNDYIAAAVNMILENISLIVSGLCDKNPIVYIGTMVEDNYIKNRLKEIAKYTGNEIYFIEDPSFAIVIGAWEYYFLKIRKNY